MPWAALLDEFTEDRFAALIVAADTLSAAPALAAVEQAGGRGRLVAWDDAVAAVRCHAGHPLLALELRGANATVAPTLELIAAAAREAELPLVVALDEDQIDAFAGPLLGGDVQLLCAPNAAERVAAVALAAQWRPAETLHDGVREGEAARLARLNDEVARIAEVLARLSRREPPAPAARLGALERRTTFDAGPIDPVEEASAAEVRQAIRSRRLRDQFLGEGLFEDPAWDMLLDLFAAHLEHGQVSVSSLCIAAAVAPTTALRWISKLSDAGLFERHPDPFDRRRAFMALSSRGLEGMRGYVSAVKRAGLAIA